jgi:phosphatidylglycerol lysyltransferase
MEAGQDGGPHGLKRIVMAVSDSFRAVYTREGTRYDIERARELILEYGWNSTSFQIINPGIKRWFSAAKDAVVGYALASGVRVAVGGPVCDKARLHAVAREFEGDAETNFERVCYFGAERRLESVYATSKDHTKFLLGAQPAWNPTRWPDVVVRHKSLRAQLNRARNKGVVVSEWPVEQARDDHRLSKVLMLWLESKGLPPLHFMVESDTLARLDNRRVFVARCEEDVVGFVVLSPVPQRKGWLFEQFPHRPGAPNGTVELMIDAAMRSLSVDGCEYATLGLSPLSKRARVEPFDNPVWLRVLLAWLRKHGQRFYNFDGLDHFKAKLAPDRWEPVFALSNERSVSLKTLYAIAGAFSGNATLALVSGGLRKAVVSEVKWLRQKL